MGAKQVCRLVETISNRLMAEADRIAKLRDKVEDSMAACDMIDVSKAEDVIAASTSISEATKLFRTLSWELSCVSDKIDECQFLADQICDIVDELTPRAPGWEPSAVRSWLSQRH